MTATKQAAKALGLHKNNLPNSVVDVIATLKRAGFDAYIVGGGVRDALLNLAPKDFDAVTNARPNEIKQVFGGRCRIIGKRFQLAHVYSGREMIEVATFRRAPDETGQSTGGMIVRDNVWGDINDDFARRDFSINALYYDPLSETVCDFCGALADINAKRLRLLGQAAVRIQEDPVRLLRALRFKAKLGFAFDKALARQFSDKNWALLEQVSTHRLYDETQKMFTGGYLSALLPLLYEYKAADSLFIQKMLTPFMQAVANNTDKRIAAGNTANAAFFYAVILWDSYLHYLQKFKKKLGFYDAQIKAAKVVAEKQRHKTAMPKFAEEFITQIWLMQPRLVNPKPKEVTRLLTYGSFRAAYDFLLMRKACNNPLAEPVGAMADWWARVQQADPKMREQLIKSFGKKGAKSAQTDAELNQLHKLALPGATVASNPPRPLFDSGFGGEFDSSDSGSINADKANNSIRSSDDDKFDQKLSRASNRHLANNAAGHAPNAHQSFSDIFYEAQSRQFDVAKQHALRAEIKAITDHAPDVLGAAVMATGKIPPYRTHRAPSSALSFIERCEQHNGNNGKQNSEKSSEKIGLVLPPPNAQIASKPAKRAVQNTPAKSRKIASCHTDHSAAPPVLNSPMPIKAIPRKRTHRAPSSTVAV